VNTEKKVDLIIIPKTSQPKEARNKKDAIDKLKIHEECASSTIHSSMLFQYIDRYPESLTKLDKYEETPLHILLQNRKGKVEDTLAMMEKNPDVLKYANRHGHLPIHIECMNRGRSVILAKLIELYPESSL
jgi:hypothetical protein